MPENSSLTEVRENFDLQKDELIPSIANHFEDLLGKMERGEIK